MSRYKVPLRLERSFEELEKVVNAKVVNRSFVVLNPKNVSKIQYFLTALRILNETPCILRDFF